MTSEKNFEIYHKKIMKENNSSKSKYTQLFTSKKARELKQQICDIGKRLWLREYVDGNGGNISCRFGDLFLCTPTGVSKGFLREEMICLVDIEGNQLAGKFRRTSEMKTHLSIYKTNPAALAVTHAHPVHATAFAIAGIEPPQCLTPEIEVLVGRVPVAPYATPGSAEMSKIIGPLGKEYQAILMGNHGLICWGTSVEDSYFKIEITDAFCRTAIIASHIPGPKTQIPGKGMVELLNLKKGMNLPDARYGQSAAQFDKHKPWNILDVRR